MDKELTYTKDRNVWTEVLDEGKRRIPLKWIFKVKNDGRRISRLVELGYRQVEGLNYSGIHDPVLNEVVMRMMSVISMEKGWEIEKLDFEESFLLGKLKEDIYIEFHDGIGNIHGKIGSLNYAFMD